MNIQTFAKTTGEYFLIVLLAGVVASCASSPTEKTDKPLVEGPYRISADRQALDELRKDIPTDKRIENDEKALLLSLTQEVKYPPSDVREKFQRIVRKKREAFDKSMTKRREQFSRDEKKLRDENNKKLIDDRKDFMAKKASSDERRDFFNDQDTKRRDFNVDERMKRDDFEADIRTDRKNFEDYIKQMNDDFKAEMDSYQQRWTEHEKELKEKRDSEKK